MKETNKTRLALRERAEDYSKTELQEFLDLWEKSGGKEFLLETDMLERFVNSDCSMLSVYGAKGMGKTFFVRMALLMLKKDYVYIPYYETRTIPKFQSGEIVVIDDIHYLIDDIIDGKQPENALDDILSEAFAFAESGKGKVIFISEDAFTSDYMDGEKYQSAYPILKRNEIFIRTFGKTVCRSLAINDYRLQKFFLETRPTMRGAISFLRQYGTDWTVICRKALSHLPEKTIMELNKSYLPLTMEENGWKHQAGTHNIDWDDLYRYYIKEKTQGLSQTEKDKFMNAWYSETVTEKNRIVWNFIPPEKKKELWKEVYSTINESRETSRKQFKKDMNGAFTSAWFRYLVSTILGDCLYIDQSYYDYLMDTIGAKKIKPRKKKKVGKLTPPEEYMSGYIEKEWE